MISYPWATALVYRAYGEAPPAPAGAALGRWSGRQGRRTGAGMAGPARRGGEGAEARRARGPARGPRDAESRSTRMICDGTAAQMPDWKTISVALPAPNTPRVVLTLDSGDGGQPQKRATLTLNRRTGETVRWEPFSSQSSGTQRARGCALRIRARSTEWRGRRSQAWSPSAVPCSSGPAWPSRCAALPRGADARVADRQGGVRVQVS